ncbi:malonate-semialdehyde dehydrogenase, partial [Desulfobacteraceae bacterium SEEP-SAG10]
MNQGLTQIPAVPLHIGGKHHASSTTEWRDVVNPATQEIVARVPFSTTAEVELAISTAKEAFK